ncbi:carbohydrate ABC transporter permease [Microbacterium sp.]|uniref:carbohydrate ABC transporter permease n=1 Tax=Microbacterium sp. TaxID=51671 RepID=UPI001AC1AE1B|nr:sugar ABC transporter permease [Microbacterium sp.]MBN9193559.1 sugar ABC transporter permease [Microbacterium sp.]
MSSPLVNVEVESSALEIGRSRAAELRRTTPGARRARRRRRVIGLLFLLPALVINLVVIGGPGLSSIYYAFTDWNGFTTPHFTGLANAERLIGDQEFWNAIGHNFVYLVAFLTVPMALGLLGAFLLSRIRRGVAVFRVLFFIPYLIASVINAQIWKNLLDPTSGLAAGLDKIGIHILDDVYFFGDSNLALYSVIGVDNWTFWGFLVILFLAAMQGIDPSRFEAARIDGASAWQEVWHVALPGIRPTLMFALMIISLWSLLAFDYAYVLTGGGPAGASDLVSLLVNRTAFGNLEAGYAAFIALAMSLLGGIFLFIFSIIRRNEDETN